MKHAYRFVRAYGRYVGLDRGAITALVLQAERNRAPADAYYPAQDGGWATVSELERQANKGSIVAANLLRKVREYAGVRA